MVFTKGKKFFYLILLVLILNNPIFKEALSASIVSRMVQPDVLATANSVSAINWGNWGDWGPKAFCDTGKFVVGFKTKIEPEGTNDDTGLNGLILLCSDKKELNSSNGEWGPWADSFSICPNNRYVTGFQVKVQDRQGNGDDTATNAVRLMCSDGSVIKSNEGIYGSFAPEIFSCDCGYQVCGFRTQVESYQGGYDDTAMNNIEMYCCN